MSNKCNSKCWWRCGIPSLEHIDPSIQQQLFSKSFWFLEQDCDSECYCSTSDNLNEDCEIGQIKYGNCLNYTEWNTTSYHDRCKNLSPPQQACGTGCCDTTNGTKICCDGSCVLSEKCCGGKVLGLDEECCDDKVVKKCKRFQNPDGGDSSIQNAQDPQCGKPPCGDQRCGCDDEQECCENTCVEAGKCCGGILNDEDRVCCNNKLCPKGDYQCVNNDKGIKICCRSDKVTGQGTCCTGGKIPCGNGFEDECCNRKNCIENKCNDCPDGETRVQFPAECKPPRGKCIPKGHVPCGCEHSCKINEKCFVANKPGPGGQPGPNIDLCCGPHEGYAKSWIGGQWGCCNMNRIGGYPDTTNNNIKTAYCCPQGTKACSDSICRKRCYTCGGGGLASTQECEDDESCCPGGGCYKRNRGKKCCFGRSGLAHICEGGQTCCGSSECCKRGEVCCGGDGIENLQCMPIKEFKCCVPFGPCPIDTSCCGPNCCQRTERCIDGQCFGPGDIPLPGA